MHQLAKRKRRLVFLLALLVLLGIAGQAEASDGMRGDRCEVGPDDYIVEDFYFFCRILDVYGTIEGDLIGVAAEITLHRGSRVTGDVWAGGGRLLVEGAVGDDMHFFGLTTIITDVARFTNPRVDLMAVTLNAEIQKDAVLPGDLLVYGYQARVAGTVGGDIDFGGEALVIEGVVVGRVDAEVGDARRSADVPDLPFFDLSFENPGLYIAPGALIERDVAYRSVTQAQIPPDTVRGRVRFERIGGQPDITRVAQPDDAAKLLREYLAAVVRDVLSLVILGAVALRLVPNVVRQPAIQVRRRTIPAIGWGLATFMLSIPLVIAVLLVGLLVVAILYTIGLGALTLLTGVGVLLVTGGMVGGFTFLLFFMGRVVISFVVGQLLYRYVLRIQALGQFRHWLGMLALGAVIYASVTNLPLPAMGLVLELITALAGVGAVAMYGRLLIQESGLLGTRFGGAAAPATVLPPVPEMVLLSEPPPPGLDNLPEGFTGFDEDW
jgi:hypothetical protein